MDVVLNFLHVIWNGVLYLLKLIGQFYLWFLVFCVVVTVLVFGFRVSRDIWAEILYETRRFRRPSWNCLPPALQAAITTQLHRKSIKRITSIDRQRRSYGLFQSERFKKWIQDKRSAFSGWVFENAEDMRRLHISTPCMQALAELSDEICAFGVRLRNHFHFEEALAVLEAAAEMPVAFWDTKAEYAKTLYQVRRMEAAKRAAQSALFAHQSGRVEWENRQRENPTLEHLMHQIAHDEPVADHGVQ